MSTANTICNPNAAQHCHSSTLTTPINNPSNRHPRTTITSQHTLTLKTTSHTLSLLVLTFSASIHLFPPSIQPNTHPNLITINIHMSYSSTMSSSRHETQSGHNNSPIHQHDLITALLSATPRQDPSHNNVPLSHPTSHTSSLSSNHTAHHTTVTQSSPPSVKS